MWLRKIRLRERQGEAEVPIERLLAVSKKMTRYVVITPIRDEEKFIEATIASVQGQSVRPAEWVIVDDGSTDRTGEIIDRYAARLP